ncbi:MAG: hypothetical protein AABZ10_01915 [Nitrospirota bacterium]
MAQYDDLDPESSDGPEALTTVSCKLFGDMVIERLCVLRRRELNARGGFTCEGCATDVKKCHEHSRPMGSCEPKR